MMEPIITSSIWNSRAEKKGISHPNFIWGMFLFLKTTPSDYKQQHQALKHFTISGISHVIKLKSIISSRLQRSCGGGSSDEVCQKRCRHVNPTCLQPDVRCIMCL